jgi:uncharacterized membrane protein (DUF106 family)
MTGALAQLVIWLNTAANAVGGILLSPIGLLPGWLSATLVSAVTGVVLLVAFKYTSNQRAMKRTRDDVNAHLLALKLFKDSATVAFRAQGRILWGALRLMALSVAPLLIMALPVVMVLAQLALWYQFRPLRVGEDAVVTLQLNGEPASPMPAVRLRPTDAVETAVGPVRVLSRREVCWNLTARQGGYHRLVFEVNGQPVEKELAVGDGFMRVSTERPGWSWSDALLHPAERPFGPDSPVQSIAIDYPRHSSWTGITDWWVYYWFIVSTVAALCFRRVLNVNV